MTPGPTGIVFAVAALALWAAAGIARFRITSPAADWFAVVAGTAAAGATALFVGFLADEPLLVLFAAIVIGLVLPLPWALFSFDYVGREELVSRRPVAIIAAPIVVGLTATAVLFGDQVVPWVSLPAQPGATGAEAVLLSVLSLSQFFALLYAGGVMMVGSGLILWTFQRYRHLDSTTGVALVTFGTVPWVSVLFALQLESVSFVAFSALLALGFLFGTVSAVALIGPFPLFARVPAAGGVGPRTVMEELTDLVVVTDGSGTVVELNAAARDQFDRGMVDRSVATVLGADLAELRDRNTIELTSDTGRASFEPTVSMLTDQHGQQLGYAIVLRDVTTRITRRQRLEVMNRILRHNLRNDISVIAGHGDLIQERTDDSDVAESAGLIADKSEELIDVTESARDAEKVLDVSPGESGPTPIEPVVETVFQEVADAGDATFAYDGDGGVAVPLTPGQLESVLQHLVGNAVEHNDAEPSVRVTVREDPSAPYPVHLSVADDGPGIPGTERQVIEAGSESPLEHSSGIGLWIVRWITTMAGGEIAFAEREPHGSIVTLRLPAASELVGTGGS